MPGKYSKSLRTLRLQTACATVVLFTLLLRPQAKAQSVYATTGTGSHSSPSALAYDNTHKLLYVILSGSNAVDVISLPSAAVTKTIALPTGSNPQAIDVNPTSGLVYVSEGATNSVTIINPSSSYSITTVAGGTAPQSLAYNSFNGKVYVVDTTSSGYGTITIVDPAHANSITTLSTGFYNLSALAINQATGMVYVTSLGLTGCSCNGNLLTINPTTNAQSSSSAGKVPGAIAIDQRNGNVFVSNQSSNNVYFYDRTGSLLASSVKVGSQPQGMAVDGSGLVYVQNPASNNMSVINPSNGYSVTTIPLGTSPALATANQVVYDSAANLVAVAVSGGVSYISPATLTVQTTVQVYSDPSALITNAAAEQTFSANKAGLTVSIFTD